MSRVKRVERFEKQGESKRERTAAVNFLSVQLKAPEPRTTLTI